ncbi:unnamed protein product [Pleuronectes platessa]|uniref:Uncharacterized protein n=1 Tax=Pleuronectes platessa TaxID=8262 RepID=A0A9N7UY52_PLEPL|nr:unnamed protein product [Pleuronectes platessa]
MASTCTRPRCGDDLTPTSSELDFSTCWGWFVLLDPSTGTSVPSRNDWRCALFSYMDAVVLLFPILSPLSTALLICFWFAGRLSVSQDPCSH